MSAFHCISYDSLSINPDFRERVDAARIALEQLLAEATKSSAPEPTPAPAPEPTPAPLLPNEGSRVFIQRLEDGRRININLPLQPKGKTNLSTDFLNTNIWIVSQWRNRLCFSTEGRYLDRYMFGRNGETRVVAWLPCEREINIRNKNQRWNIIPAEGGFRLYPDSTPGEYLKIADNGAVICGKEGEEGDIFTFITA
jgi:hypothetical protein